LDKHEIAVLDAIMRVVENQLRDNDPPEVQRTLARLQTEGFSEIDAKKLIRSVAAVEISNIMEKKEPFCYDRYAKGLDLLPQLPWED
jgi:Zn finger protein HypA/HybF involved in hydrogenase expression